MKKKKEPDEKISIPASESKSLQLKYNYTDGDEQKKYDQMISGISDMLKHKKNFIIFCCDAKENKLKGGIEIDGGFAINGEFEYIERFIFQFLMNNELGRGDMYRILENVIKNCKEARKNWN